MKANFTPTPSRSRPRLLEDVSFDLQSGDLALELRDLQLLRLHLTLAEERVLWVTRKLLHPIAQLCRVNTKVC
jgi:hypothetical protein